MVFLESKQGCDLLEVILDPVMHLLKESTLYHEVRIMNGNGNLVSKCTKNIELRCREFVRHRKRSGP